MSFLAYEAMCFAREVHKNQRRKYTNDPYTVHLAEVAAITSAVIPGQAFQAIAWLHDCVEDQGVTYLALANNFGRIVADHVMLLSDLETGNRAERKAASRVRLSAAPAAVQTIKVADLISNTQSIVQHDPKFAVTYLEEKRLLLDVLTKADKRLVQIAREQLRCYTK